MKKKTNAELQAEIEDLKKQIPESTNVISNCVIGGVHWDGKALESVNIVAKGLLNLTELFKAQSVTIETGISIQGVNNAKVMDSHITGTKTGIKL